MILNGSGNNLRRGSRQSVYQNDEGIIFPPISMLCHITLFRGRTSVMRNDQLAFLQKLVRYANAFAK